VRILFWSWPRIEAPSINFKGSSNAFGNQYFYFEDFVDRLKTNSGNLIHWDATNKIFDHDGETSCYFQPSKMSKDDWETFIEIVNNNFDVVLISQANSLRPDADHGGLANFIEKVDVDVYLFGLGLQEDFNASLDSVLPGTKKFLEIANTKAKLFAVRGQRTADWLSKAGIHNFHVTGCPSMYVYPHKILSAIRSFRDIPEKISRNAPLKFLSAGHFERPILAKPELKWRAEGLCNLFKGEKADYVFQSEFRGYYHLKNTVIYDPVSNEVDDIAIRNYFFDYYGITANFDKFLFFTDANMWRFAASSYDVYIGDRLHGGLVSLQAGVPSVLLYNDVRVKEIADFFMLPNFDMKEIGSYSARTLLLKSLESYDVDLAVSKYINLYRDFKNLIESKGLAFQPHYKDFEIKESV
jgi:hypothetical protein